MVRQARTYAAQWAVGLASILTVALLLAACASAEPAAEPSTPSPSTTEAPSEPAGDDQAEEPQTDDEQPPDDGDGGALAGTPIEFFFQDGDTLAVIGVAFDDVLNVRAGPGVDASIVDTLAPLADDVTATGSARQLPRSIWVEVDTGDTIGWANARYLAYVGVTDDVTGQVIDELGADRTAETMLELGRAVARTRASTEPASAIVVVAAPTVGDLGEVTIDVIGLGDDAAVGLRLHVFGAPLETDDGFDLKSVEETTLCGRGVTADGLCV